MQLYSVSRIIVVSLLIVGAVTTPPTARAQSAQSQTITSGTVKSTAPVGSGRLWLVSFKEHSSVAYASTPPDIGREVPIEIFEVSDIEGKKHPVAYVMTPKK
jgi:hypothetical protein